MNTEDRIQASIVSFVRTVAPQLLVHSVPNGAFLAGTEEQRKRQMARLKWTGLLPGVFDLTVLGPGAFVAAIEVKAGRNGLTDEQQSMRERYIAMGIPHCVARSIDDIRPALAQWGIPTREVAA